MEITYNLDGIKEVATKLVNSLSSKTLLIYGHMGVGKTTLIKAVVDVLGSKDEVSSPTFSIVNEYVTADHLIYHFDLYRIKDIEELYNLGIEEYLFTKNWIIIEWPEKIEQLISLPYNIVKLELTDSNTRTLKLIN